MKTWTLKIDEDELRALIMYHNNMMFTDVTVEHSSRIHDLTKRLNKEIPEIENAEQAQPIPTPPTSSGW